MRSIERTRPTGPAPTIKTGTTASLLTIVLESDKALHGVYPYGYGNVLILEKQLSLLVNATILIAELRKWFVEVNGNGR